MQVTFAFNPSYAALYTPPTLPDSLPIEGSLKIEMGPKTVGQIEVIYDGDFDSSGDTTVNVDRPGGLKSPLSGVDIRGTPQPDPLPLDVTSLFGIATIVGDWDQDSK